MSKEPVSAFDAYTANKPELAAMRDELAKDNAQLSRKQALISAIGAVAGGALGMAGGSMLGNAGMGGNIGGSIVPSLMGGYAGGVMGLSAGAGAAKLITVGQEKKLDINDKILQAEMSRIQAENWGKYYAQNGGGAAIPPVAMMPVAPKVGRAA